MTHLTIKDLPVSERPYEKFEKYGPQSLSDAELLAIIIKSGTRNERVVDIAGRILKTAKECEGLGGILYLKKKDLQKIKGIGPVKTTQILCLAEIYKRIQKASRPFHKRLNSPAEIAEHYMADMRCLKTECCMLLCLDSKCQVIGEKMISAGTVNSSVLSPREVFICALDNEAVSVVLLHNHPSGDPTPSREDFDVTARLKETGELLGIQLLDHIIIGDNTYLSFLEKDFI